MKLLIAVCAVGAATAAIDFHIPQYTDCDTEHAAYTQSFPHNAELYGERSDSVDRKQVFCGNLKTIIAHNELARAGNATYSQGVNEFTDWTDDELKASSLVGGAIIPSEAELAEQDMPLYEQEHEYDVDATADFRGKMPAVKNQGQCGSCWTFGAIDVVDFHAGGSHSEQQLLDCAPGNGCGGGDPRQALQYLAGGMFSGSKPSASESSYSYKGVKGTCRTPSSGAKVSSVKAVGASEGALASAAGKQVVSIAITFSASYGREFFNYHSGVFNGQCGGENGGHAIATVGLAPSYYIIRNSWGTAWGMQGYAYMARGKNICNLAQHSTVASAK